MDVFRVGKQHHDHVPCGKSGRGRLPLSQSNTSLLLLQTFCLVKSKIQRQKAPKHLIRLLHPSKYNLQQRGQLLRITVILLLATQLYKKNTRYKEKAGIICTNTMETCRDRQETLICVYTLLTARCDMMYRLSFPKDLVSSKSSKISLWSFRIVEVSKSTQCVYTMCLHCVSTLCVYSVFRSYRWRC